MSEEENPQPANAGQSQQQFSIQKVYLKDVSFETPNSPAIFTEETQPEISLQLNSKVKQLEAGLFEVVLQVTVTAQQGDKTGFLVEVQQAGIFIISGFDEAQAKSLLGSYCPNTLLPFAREAISDLVTKGGFPPLLLAPINFDALYEQQLANSGEQADSPSIQ